LLPAQTNHYLNIWLGCVSIHKELCYIN